MARRNRNKKHTRKGDSSASASAPIAEIPSTKIGFADGTDSLFTCTICLDVAELPVVTQCGHLYCWPCLYQWLGPGMTSAERQAIAPQHDEVEHEDDVHDRPSLSCRRVCPACKAPCSVNMVVPIYVGGKDENHDSNEASRPGTTSNSMPASGGREASRFPPRPSRVITEELTLTPTHPIQPRSPTRSTGSTFAIPTTLSLSDISGASMNHRLSDLNIEFDRHQEVDAGSTTLHPNDLSFGSSPQFLALGTSATTRHRPDSPYPDLIGSSTAVGELPQSYARERPYTSTDTFLPSGVAPSASDPIGATPPTTPNLFLPTTGNGAAFDARAFVADYFANRPFAYGGGGATAVSTLPPYFGGASSRWQYNDDVPNMTTTTTLPATNSAVFGNIPTSDPAMRNSFWGETYGSAAPHHAWTPLLDHHYDADYWQAWSSGYSVALRAFYGYGGAEEGWRWGYSHGPFDSPAPYGGVDEEDGMIPQASPPPYFGGPVARFGF